jgi:ATP-binding cassette subfamily B protein
MSSNAFPFFHQLEAEDCGPACLKMIASYYGSEVSLVELREKCHLTRSGVSMAGIHDAAENIGLKAMGVRISWKLLRDEVPLPCIVHWKGNHFVVVYDIKEKKNSFQVLVADPAIGLLEYKESDFLRCWCEGERGETGAALLLEPTPNLRKGKEEKKNASFLHTLSLLKPHWSKMVGILGTMLLATLLSMLLPFLTQAVVDKGIGTKDLSLVGLLLIGQFALVLGMTANQFIRSRLVLKTSYLTGISIITAFLDKLMNLPLTFFESRRVGDIMQRITDCNRIQSYLTGTLISMLVSILSLIVYSVVMGRFNLGILGVFVVGAMLYILWVFLFMERRKELDYKRFQVSSVQQSNIVEMISGMGEIKLNNCGRKMRKKWADVQFQLMDVSMKGLYLAQIQEIGGVFIDQTKNLLITYFAARSVIKGNMTLGMMMAVQYIMGQLSAPIHQILAFLQNTQDAVLSHKRIGEIYEMENEEPDNQELLTVVPANASLFLSDMCFRYAGADSDLFHKINLTIPAGKTTALVGASGSGKTTLLKLLMGFYRPNSGKIYLGEHPLSDYSVSAWRACCGSVMQEGFLFDETTGENIALSDMVPDMDRIRQSAFTARIQDWIESLPKGYDTVIGANGSGLSTGQKQRILIARAAYKNAQYLFFDEATNSLDAENEASIMNNLNSIFKGKTVIIAAHRLSTIRNADIIIVLDKGDIVESGTHQSLLERKGKYYELVQKQTK